MQSVASLVPPVPGGSNHLRGYNSLARPLALAAHSDHNTASGGAFMANEEHLRILRSGVEAWNEWRQSNVDVRPDLIRADLCHAQLKGADLNRANLSGANMAGTNLIDA